MKAKTWLISWLIIVVSVLSICGFWVYKIDPYFHYHKPDLDNYFYTLNNQRSQNDGIIRHFDYDALISGTSMTENFKTTEADKIYGCKSIKVAYAGGSYKEINDNIKTALKANANLRTVIRCLDMEKFFDPYNLIRTDLGTYPTYLYDNNPFNDAEYLLNRDILFGRSYQMKLDRAEEGFEPGITKFDDYSSWQSYQVFGINTVSPYGIAITDAEQLHLTEDEKSVIKKNIELNVTRTADDHPDVDFYYYYSPYSIAWWADQKNNGTLFKQLEAEAYITELIVPHKNIHLFSFNNRTDIITDLNNYKDTTHYASWINTLTLKWMHDDQYRLTEDNYKDYLKQEYDFYTTFDYACLDGQIDYEEDYYAAALLNKDLTGADPLDVLNDEKVNVAINRAEYIKDDNGKNAIVDCHGTLAKDGNYSRTLADYLRDEEFIGIKFDVNLDDGYNYLSFNGQKLMDHGRPTACVYDENGTLVEYFEADYEELDNEVHQYVIDLSAVGGKVTVVLNGGYVDASGSPDSNYQFSNIYMY